MSKSNARRRVYAGSFKSTWNFPSRFCQHTSYSCFVQEAKVEPVKKKLCAAICLGMNCPTKEPNGVFSFSFSGSNKHQKWKMSFFTSVFPPFHPKPNMPCDATEVSLFGVSRKYDGNRFCKTVGPHHLSFQKLMLDPSPKVTVNPTRNKFLISWTPFQKPDMLVKYLGMAFCTSVHGPYLHS